MQYLLTNSEQAKEFRAGSPGGASTSTSIVDRMSATLAKLARRAMGTVDEGFRGSMDDTAEVQRIRDDFDRTITEINSEYAKTVTYTGDILDKFGKKVDTQEQLLIDAVKDFNWRSKQDQHILNTIAGQKEDSAIYQRMGSAKYTIYALIALVIIGLTMTHMDLNLTAYLAMATVLSGVFIFILMFFYWKKSVYSTS